MVDLLLRILSIQATAEKVATLSTKALKSRALSQNEVVELLGAIE